MSPLARWRPALRIAWREAWRAKGRSALVLLLIALPVMGVVALDSLYRTSEVSTVEGLDRRLGTADALVTDVGAPGPMDQDPAAQATTWNGSGPAVRVDPVTIRRALGADARLTPVVDATSVGVRTADGVATVASMQLDLRDPVTRGLVRRVSGGVPSTRTEVAVSPALAARGLGPGSRLTLADGSRRQVVGVVDSATDRDSLFAVGVPGWLPGAAADAAATTSYLVQTGHPVTWADVRRANHAGLMVLSRAVVKSPPPASEVPADVRSSGSTDSSTLEVVALVAAMAVIEVVLLAGPALAVGTRRQQRSHALMRVAGARPGDVRRAVLATGAVLGTCAAVTGLVLGVLVARVAEPGLQSVTDSWFGPFEVSWRDTLLVALAGTLSAVLASYVPARLATRLDVVAVLAGRRGDPRPTYRSPVAGLVLLGAGIAGAVSGAGAEGGELLITASAVLSVLGMVLLVPVVVDTVGRLARWLPLSLRYAVRDAARHRTRTAPAVAAIAATVAGVVALGIGAASDGQERSHTYSPSGPMGAAVVRGGPDAASWLRARRVVHRVLPRASVLAVRGAPTSMADGRYVMLSFFHPGPGFTLGSAGGSIGAQAVVGPVSPRRLGLTLPPGADAEVAAVLRRGGVAVLGAGPAGPSSTTMTLEIDGSDGSVVSRRHLRLPAVFVTPYGGYPPFQAIVAPGVLERLGLRPSTTALVVDGVGIDKATEQRLQESLTAVSGDVTVSVERGYQEDGSTRLALLLLAAVGGTLMLGGTLTATFLALSDARPDLATLAAVGAQPRRRRAVAAAYATVTGLLGAVLGALVGFVPGIAVSFPLTRSVISGAPTTDVTGRPLPSHFLDVPWLLVIGIVVLLPVLTALVVAAVTRSRLPMTSRVS